MKRFCDVFQGDPDAVPTFRFKADGGREAWALVDGHCDDPACRACRSEVRLVPADPTREPVEFEISLRDGDLYSPEDWTDEQDALCREFLDTPETHHALLRRFQAIRLSGLPRGGRSPGVWDNKMLAFDDFSPHRESLPIVFRHAGADWLAHDSACVQPACGCKDTLLSFCRNVRRAREEFVMLVDVSTGRASRPEQGGVPAPPAALLADFQSSMPDWRFELSRRRRLLRAAAAALMTFPPLARPLSATTPAAGRNDPCPCGSGKKHKKCCGA